MGVQVDGRTDEMIILKNEAEIDGMRSSGQVTARVRDAIANAVSPGVTTKELSDYAGELIKKLGGQSAFFGYRGFPGQICVSVNEEVVHGIPGRRIIELGDIVSIDVGVKYEGFIGDTATTVMVGVTDAKVIRLVRTTEKALGSGIAAAVEGQSIRDISSAIEHMVIEAGFSVVREFVGHGVGRTMHEDPQVPNFVSRGHKEKLKHGMTLAIEPMVNMGKAGVEVLEDGWTVVTKDKMPSAHFEHTIAVLKDRVEVLTVC
jgi:methionyl aminopeptidase